MEILSAEALNYSYPDTKGLVLEDVNICVEDGEFLLLLGDSGCGKSTLLRALGGLVPDFYGGRFGGGVYFRGKNISNLSRRQLTKQVGIVFQDPELQLVKTRVEQEIAFGLENLGLSQTEMSKRVAEALNFFGLSELKERPVAELSGGQKQKVILASILAMQPSVLLLDEPTSQLDPVAAEDVLTSIKRLNEELGLAVVLIEQRVDRCIHLADRIVVMDKGRVVKEGSPQEMAHWAVQNNVPILPPVARFFAKIGAQPVPLTVGQGRKYLNNIGRLTQANVNKDERTKQRTSILSLLNFSSKKKATDVLLKVDDLWFAYQDGKESLKGISFTLEAGEFAVILGENGAGKSTLLKHLSGLLKPSRGRVILDSNDIKNYRPKELTEIVGYLGQNPNDYLFNDTVEAELTFTLNNLGRQDDGIIDKVLTQLELTSCRHVNPRDLSGGQRQRVALASVLVAQPEVLLLDEPTRGLDNELKRCLGEILRKLTEQGTAVLMITHDLEFAAEYGRRALLLFDGQIIADGDKHEVLANGVFYSPQMQKLFRGSKPTILTVEEGLRCWEGLQIEVV